MFVDSSGSTALIWVDRSESILGAWEAGCSRVFLWKGRPDIAAVSKRTPSFEEAWSAGLPRSALLGRGVKPWPFYFLRNRSRRSGYFQSRVRIPRTSVRGLDTPGRAPGASRPCPFPHRQSKAPGNGYLSQYNIPRSVALDNGVPPGADRVTVHVWVALAEPVLGCQLTDAITTGVPQFAEDSRPARTGRLLKYAKHSTGRASATLPTGFCLQCLPKQKDSTWGQQANRYPSA